MNGVARGKQSSQCHWSEVRAGGAAVAASLDPVRQVAVLSPRAHDAPAFGAERSATLAQILASQPELAVSRPRNPTHSVVLVRSGRVWLLLSPEDYYKAGLDGKKVGQKYLAVYDTRAPGKRLDRFRWALEHTLADVRDFVVSTSVPAATPRAEPRPLLVPPLFPPDGEDADGEAFADWANQFLEWVGLAAAAPHLLAGGEPPVDAAIAANYTPDDAAVQSAAVSCTAGLFTASQVEALWASLQDQEWAVLSVQGFAQTPVSRADKPRDNGELGYVLVRRGEQTAVFRYT